MLSLTLIGNVFAQHELDDETLRNANNPLAQTKFINVHNYMINDVYGIPDVSQNMLLLRYGQPLGKFLLCGTLPVLSSSIPGSAPKTGLADLNLFGIYILKKNAKRFGIGPLITAPVGTHGFSTDKWLGGVTLMAFLPVSPALQTGTLIQWQKSFAGKSSAPDAQTLTTQFFAMLQIGRGIYLRSTGIWMFNLENGDYNIPFGFGIGKIAIIHKKVFNIFAEPQFSVLAEGIGQPRFQVFCGINTQF